MEEIKVIIVGLCPTSNEKALHMLSATHYAPAIIGAPMHVEYATTLGAAIASVTGANEPASVIVCDASQLPDVLVQNKSELIEVLAIKPPVIIEPIAYMEPDCSLKNYQKQISQQGWKNKGRRKNYG